MCTKECTENTGILEREEIIEMHFNHTFAGSRSKPVANCHRNLEGIKRSVEVISVSELLRSSCWLDVADSEGQVLKH